MPYNVKTFYTQITKNSPLLFKYQFQIELFAGNENLTKGFTYYVQSGSIPKFDITKGKVAYFGMNFNVPGTIKYEHDWKCKLLLDQNMTMYEKFRKSMLEFSNLKDNGGGPNARRIPNYDIHLNVLDNEQDIVKETYVLVRCLAFPSWGDFIGI